MDELIKLAEMIKDENLRKKVVDFLKNPQLTSKDFKKYKASDIKKVFTPFSSVSGSYVVKRDVYKHTIAVVKACLKMAKLIEEVYGLKCDKDALIAGAILHDIGKIFEWKAEKEKIKHTNILLDHTTLITAELYKRNFPEKVIHIVAAHFGEGGPIPPRNFEAWLLHRIDNMLADLELRIGEPVASPVALLSDELLRRMDETHEGKNKIDK
ncbi:MAG: HDIG domain-containing protein [Candidatus Aenigmarchaeota archaeon]|nr:HDIG domain-containing protein [Candidatus Aenigmarchaeota archaeon]